MASIKLLYFAWVRERIGRGEETLDIPDEVAKVSDLKAWLCLRGPEYVAAFEKPEAVRTAIDQQHASADSLLVNVREVAFFPPVTGG